MPVPKKTCHCLRRTCLKCRRYLRAARKIVDDVACGLNAVADEDPARPYVDVRTLARRAERSAAEVRFALDRFPYALRERLNYGARGTPWREGSRVDLGV